MNKLKKLKYQYIISNYIKNNSLNALSDLIYNIGPEIYDCLTEKEITTITDLAIKNKDKNHILSHLLLYGKNIDSKKIIKNISVFELNSKIFSKYLNEFIEVAINERKNILIHIARFIALEPEKYPHEIALIKNYLLSNDINYITTTIAPLKGFSCPELENKIITSEVKFVSDYLIKAPNKINFFKNYYLTKPTTESIKKIVHRFTLSNSPSNTQIYKYIVDVITAQNLDDPTLQSNHLLALYDFNKEYKDIDKIIYSLINLNVPTAIKELMNDLSSEKQNKICNSFLEDKNTPPKYLKTLAITTNCESTYKLIDKIISQDDIYEIVDLIGNLDGRFLSYALDQILKTKASKYYLNIINKLYLLGYANCLTAITFIFQYQLEHLFTPKTIKKLSSYSEENLKRVRKM